MDTTRKRVREATEHIRTHIHHEPSIGLILGSGLGRLAARLAEPDIIPYDEIPHFPQSTVTGHSGRLVTGILSSIQVLMMRGRVHYYEGYSTSQIGFPVRVMQELGVETLFVTNASGSLRPDWAPGDLMAIKDHINLPGLMGHHPLRGSNDETFGPRFPSMSQAYDPELCDLLHREAEEQGVALREGIYVMVSGPSFETPAEVRFLRSTGADVVGMSTVPEVVVARHGGMRVLGISLISNVATDSLRKATKTTHQEVLNVGEKATPILASLIEGMVARLA
ncbi:MAG: purine-nucleoside phosphorylase [Anaerolineales bacterium]